MGAALGYRIRRRERPVSDFRIANVTIRLEDDTLPSGVIQSQARLFSSDDSSGGPGCGCSCSCSCSCTCTCTCTASSHLELEEFQAVELVALRESLRIAIAEVERAQRDMAAG